MQGTTICRVLSFAAVTCLAGAGVANGQDYPNKPIRLVVANTPGTIADVAARVVAPDLARALATPVLVENRPGSGGLLGYEYVARQAPADGYTVVVVFVQDLPTLPLTVKDLRFDTLKELPPIIGLVEGRFIFGSAAGLPWKSFNELVAYAKANPGKLNYGSSSSLSRLITEALVRDLGISVVHVPYAGGGPYLQGVVSGEVHMGIVNEPTAMSWGEKFRGLAVTGAQRLPALREVPTFSELGHPRIPGFSYSLNVRAGTPKAAVDKIYGAAVRTLDQPDVRSQFAKLRLEILGGTPEDAARYLAEQARFFADIARKVGIQPQ